MRATARRTGAGWQHRVEIRQHELTVDEPADQGGEDTGPTPQEMLAASIAACVAITVEMYAKRKEWDLEHVEVSCEYETAQRGSATRFEVTVRVPASLTQDQADRLRVIAGKCPVHRTLTGEVEFVERVERADAPAAE